MDTSNHQREKTVIAVTLFVGVTTLIFGFLSINKSIYAPFVSERNYHIKTDKEIEDERVAKLKAADTDKDGLNDYDELYVFRTSPFLEDSDSDGIPDGREVAAGSDPNCSAGKTCRQARVSGTPDQSAFVSGKFDQTVSALNQASSQKIEVKSPDATQGQSADTAAQTVTTAEEMNQLITDTFGDVSKLSSEQFKAKVEGLSSQQMRDFMAKLGIPKETLDQTGDQALRGVIEEALGEAMQSYAAPATDNKTTK